MIDPVQNMDKMEHIPKYFFVAPGDEFLMSHWPQMYWDKIPGEKHLYIMANTDHSMVTGLYTLIYNIAAFVNNVNAKTSEVRPTFKNFVNVKNGELTIVVPTH